MEGFSLLTVCCLKSVDIDEDWSLIVNLPSSLLILSIDRLSDVETWSLRDISDFVVESDDEVGTWNTMDVCNQFVEQLLLVFAPSSLETDVEGDLHLPKLQRLTLKLRRWYGTDDDDGANVYLLMIPP